MNRPLVSVIVAYGAGLLTAQFWQPPLTALFFAAFLTLALTVALGQLRPYLLALLLALTGWANLLVRTVPLAPDDLRLILGDAPAIATVRGELIESPRLKISVRNGQELWHHTARCRVTSLRLTNSFAPATGEVLVTTPGLPSPDLFAGQTVEVNGVIARPPGALAPGLFDYQKYLATRGIYYQLKTESTNDWSRLAPIPARPPWTDRFLKWAQATLALGLPGEDEPLRLLWAMTLGWRTAFTGDVGDPFLRAGTMHMFAIDGLRIALLSGMLVTLLRVLRLSRAWCGAVAVPVIWFYTAATGWESSAVRASIMMTVILGGWALKRPSDLVNSLAAAALIILLWDPRQLFEAGFQLSFSVMAVIAVMLPPLDRFFNRGLKFDPLLPEELVPRWKRAGLWFCRHLARYAGLSFAAWIGSMPLSAKYFHLFSPVSTPANILAVPIGTLALMSNLGALICGHWLPWLTECFNHAAWFFMVAMTWVSVEAARLPGAYFYVPEPSLAAILIFYAAILAGFSGWFRTPARKLTGAALLLALGGIFLWQWQASRRDTCVTVLPLNGGHAVHVDAAGRENDWLINCGNDSAVNYTLKNFLRARGVNSLPRLVLTEGDVKNCGGARALDGLFPVGELWTSPAKFRSPAYREAVAWFENPPSRHRFLNTGEVVGVWRVLFPDASSHFARADDQPLVLLGNFDGIRILLLADLSRAGQSALLTQTHPLTAEIVVAGLPGAGDGEPLCDALIAAIRPKVILIADSGFPALRRAGRPLRERLGQQSIPVIYTRTAGAVTLTVGRRHWELKSMDGQRLEGGPGR